jgi:hypothetical protein
LLKHIDDFLIMGKAGINECSHNLQVFKDVRAELFLPLKDEKKVSPTTVLDFLGIILDTDKLEIRLAEERVKELMVLLQRWETRKACRKRELLSLIGKLAHACKVVRVGRIFLRRMIDLATTARRLNHWIHISAQFREDLNWWLPSWNHRQEFQHDQHQSRYCYCL